MKISIVRREICHYFFFIFYSVKNKKEMLKGVKRLKYYFFKM